METDINLPFITADQTGPKHLQMKLTRAKFEQLVDDLLQKTVGPTKQALADAGLDPSKIDEVVLVGGSTRIPKVQQIVKELFGQGAAQGRQPGRGRRHRRGGAGGRARRRRQGSAAARRDAALARHRDDGRRDDDADSAQHDDSHAEERDLLDRRRQPDERRSPRAAGRALAGARQPDARQVPSRSAFRRRRAACRRSKSPSTSTPTASSTCQAKDLGTGKEQKITITASSGLSKDEVDRMMKEAESHADEDKKRERRNRGAQPRRPGGVRRRALPQGHGRQARRRRDRQAIETATESLKKAIEANDAAAHRPRARAADSRRSTRRPRRCTSSRRLAVPAARAPAAVATGRRARPARPDGRVRRVEERRDRRRSRGRGQAMRREDFRN